MANSIRENILAKLKTLMEGLTGVGTVQRLRTSPIDNDVAFPALFIFEERETITTKPSANMGQVYKNLFVTLQAWAIDEGGDVSVQINELLKNVEKRAMSNPTFDGLAIDTIPLETRNFIEVSSVKGEGYIGFEFDIQIQYRHTFYDPETAI